MNSLRRTHMPYCIYKLTDGRYIILNRNYKPLGIQTGEWVTYETHPTAVAIEITPEEARQLSWEASANPFRIYLYHDGSVPTDSDAHMSAYLFRLALLMKIKAQQQG